MNGTEGQSVIQRHALLGLAAFVMLLFTVYAFAITFWHPVVDPTIQGMILGTLGSSGFGAVMQYFFGSSSGSASKSDTINKLTANGQTGK